MIDWLTDLTRSVVDWSAEAREIVGRHPYRDIAELNRILEEMYYND